MGELRRVEVFDVEEHTHKPQLAGMHAGEMRKGAVFFVGWRRVLRSSELPRDLIGVYERCIADYLAWCSGRSVFASFESAKVHLSEQAMQQPSNANVVRDALRWWFRLAARMRETANPRAARQEGASTPFTHAKSAPAVLMDSASAPPAVVSSIPSAGPLRRARDDLGAAPWEQELIRACRSRHLLWRTEETYRRWAAQFVRFVGPGTLATCGEKEVEAFLYSISGYPCPLVVQRIDGLKRIEGFG